MGCVKLRRVKAVWDGAINVDIIKLVLYNGKIKKMEKRCLSLWALRGQNYAVVLSNIDVSDQLVHRCKSRTPSNNVSSEYLGVLVRIDLQSSF